MWLGYGFANGNAFFKVPPEKAPLYAKGVYDEKTGLVKFRNVSWFTNLDIKKRHEDMELFRKYTPEKYPRYDNYDAVEVSKIADIPLDYSGVMGVPITFLDSYNPNQFEVIGIDRYVEDNPHCGHRFKINGQEIYARILIKRKQ